MVVVRSIDKLRKIVKEFKFKRGKIGFVPTMGALHLGHLSLVRRARKECDFVVVSIFVNPIQFGPNEDYKVYPRNFPKDRDLLAKENVDVIFYPSSKTMYPSGFSTYVEEVQLSKFLCGKSRPGHFRGVCTVVAKLFNLIEPDIAYFGQKDYQQAQIIKRMVRDLNFPLKIRVMPIIREPDGLAMSSRNRYLSEKERLFAVALYESIKLCRRLIIKEKERNPSAIIKKLRKHILSYKYTKIDYIKLVDPITLEDVPVISKKVLLALAVYVGEARLIDNALIRIN